jgi:hypothetical protein
VGSVEAAALSFVVPRVETIGFLVREACAVGALFAGETGWVLVQCTGDSCRPHFLFEQWALPVVVAHRWSS